jgi:hypothetical protein
MLARLGVEPDVATAVERIVASFWAADLWRGASARPGAWVRRAGSSARLSLLFEVVHEGGVTPSMSAAAALAGLGTELDAWRIRLPTAG